MVTPSAALRKFLKKEIGSGKRILDIGCGGGSLAFYLTSLHCSVDGVDSDQGSVHRANQKLKQKMVYGKARCYTYDSLEIDKKFRRNGFDSILIIHTLHHLVNVGAGEVLKKAKRVLKRGGKIFIGEYAGGYGETRDNCPRFSEKKILSMLKTAGFRKMRRHSFHRDFLMITAVK